MFPFRIYVYVAVVCSSCYNVIESATEFLDIKNNYVYRNSRKGMLIIYEKEFGKRK